MTKISKCCNCAVEEMDGFVYKCSNCHKLCDTIDQPEPTPQDIIFNQAQDNANLSVMPPMQKEEKGELPISKCCKARVDTEDESAFCSECKNYLQDDEIIYPTPKEPEKWKEELDILYWENDGLTRLTWLKHFIESLLQSRDREAYQRGVEDGLEQAGHLKTKSKNS